MKILLTGASGRVGRCLVEKYLSRDAELVLIGRNPENLSFDAIRVQTGSYGDLESLAQGCDAVVHLAALNNDGAGDEAAFIAANVDLAETVVEAAHRAGVGRIVLFSSFHALDAANPSTYASSKRAMADRLGGRDGVEILYLPYVHDEALEDRIPVVGSLPGMLGRPAFSALAALKPTVHCSRIAAHILNPRQQGNRILLADPQSENPFYAWTTRVIDLAFAAVVFGLLWWLMLLVWVGVRASSPGPGLFAQERLGQKGESFTCYKFRTMQAGTPQRGTHEVSAASVTKIGNFLRKTKLDEFPQAWNILLNQMSLVGPRPGLPVQIELKSARERHGVFAAKPGITGLGQVSGVDMSDPERLARLDADYIAQRSLLLDLRILIATAIGKGFGDRTDKTG